MRRPAESWPRRRLRLPEEIGGVRNWDYRYCWLRDATFTLYALIGRVIWRKQQALARMAFARASPGAPSQMQIMYGVQGERRLDELELPWLSGYENSKPVRVGNAASKQFQLDVYGEVIGLDLSTRTQRGHRKSARTDWRMQVALMNFLESNWEKPDEGIWEVRGARQHFTHSKMMAWVAFDRAVKIGEGMRLCGRSTSRALGKIPRSNSPRSLRARLQPREKSVHPILRIGRNGCQLLMMPLVGFFPGPTNACGTRSRRSNAN